MVQCALSIELHFLDFSIPLSFVSSTWNHWVVTVTSLCYV